MKKEPSGAEKMFGGFAPKLVELTDDVLFGDVWERSELSKRDRSLATVARVIEIPMPCWITFDAKVFGVEVPDDVPSSIQERAFTPSESKRDR